MASVAYPIGCEDCIRAKFAEALENALEEDETMTFAASSQQSQNSEKFKCGMDKENYGCPHCRACYHCRHVFQERLDGWWIKCLGTGKWFKVVGAGCCHGLGDACSVCEH